LKIEETGSDIVGQDNESLYTGKVEIDLSLLADKDIMAKLYRYLSRTPDIKSSRTVASSDNGVIVTVMLDKPLTLVETLSSEIPEVHVIGEPASEKEKKQKVRRISITRRGS